MPVHNIGRMALMVGAMAYGATVAPKPAGAITPTDLSGRGGWGEIALCIGCGATAIAIIAAGPIAVIAAAETPGSGIAAAGCAAACIAAAKES